MAIESPPAPMSSMQQVTPSFLPIPPVIKNQAPRPSLMSAATRRAVAVGGERFSTGRPARGGGLGPGEHPYTRC